MAKYYIGNIEYLTIKRIQYSGSEKRLVTERTISKQGVIFHQNRLGVLIRTESGDVPIKKEEAEEYLYNSKKGVGDYCPFVDTSKLTPAPEITSAQAKQLKKAYKEKHSN